MKKKMFLFILAIGIIIMSSCGSPNTANPTATNTPTKTSPTATITPTSSPTPIPPPPVISASNAMNLQEDFRIGQGGVSDAAWMPDGNVALVYSTGVSIYNPDTGDLIKSVEPENKAIGNSVMSPDGKHVAMHKDNKVLVWDANTGKIEYELEARCQAQHLGYQMVAFNSDGSQLAACDEEGVVLWDLSSGNKIRVFKIKRKDNLLIAFNPKNNILVTSGTSSDLVFTDIVIWDLESGEVIKKVQENSGENIRFNHRGNILAWKNYGSESVQIVLYDINTRQMQRINVDYFEVFEFSPDDKTLILGRGYGWGTRLLDIATGKFVTEPNDNAAYLIKYDPDGSRFVAGWNDFSVFKNAGDAELKRLGSFMTYSQVAFDPKGRYIAAGEDVTLWDLQTKKRIFDHIFAYGNTFLFTPNGDGLITNAWNNNNWHQSIQQWDIRTENQQNFEGTITDSYAVIKPPLFSPSGDLLAIGTTNVMTNATYIRFWDPNSKKFLFDINLFDINSNDYGIRNSSDHEFSPDGKIFASARDKTIYFWDLNTRKTLKQLDCSNNIYDIAFSPDGALIAAAAFNGVYIWDTNSGKLISEFNEHEIRTATQVAFSPQGNILAATGYDKDGHKILFVWDLLNNRLLYKIIGDKNNDASWNLAGRAGLLFSPGGSLIVTSGLKHEGSYWASIFAEPKVRGPYSEYIQFWDTASGQLIKTLDYTVGFDVHAPYRNRYGFSPDGRLFAVADGTVHILRITASSDNGKEDILIPTLTPLPTLAPTITPTPAPTVAVESIFSNLSVVKTDTFDTPNNSKWGLDSSVAKIKNGVLQFVGKNWGGGLYNTNLREGYGVIINFKYTQDSEFEMLFDNETWNTEPYKRFGVYVINDYIETNIWQGNTPLGQALNGSLDLSPDTWYSLLLMIGKNNEFFVRIWNPSNPTQIIEYKNTFGADWSGLPWTFRIGAKEGTILFDDFKEVEIK